MNRKTLFFVLVILALVAWIPQAGASVVFQRDEIPPFDPNLKPVQMRQEEFDELRSRPAPTPGDPPVRVVMAGPETAGKLITLGNGEQLQLSPRFYVSEYFMFISCSEAPCPIPPIVELSRVNGNSDRLSIDASGVIWDSLRRDSDRRGGFDAEFKEILDRFPDAARMSFDGQPVPRGGRK